MHGLTPSPHFVAARSHDLAKAVILLCAARKSRDADHLQNFVYDALAGIDADKLAAELLKAGKEKVLD